MPAVFPGSSGTWAQYLTGHLKFNTPSKHGAPVGIYKVECYFTIDTTGKIYDVQILKDPGYGTAEDVKRVILKSPHWIPASNGGLK